MEVILYNTFVLTVIIPTRNRPELLRNLLKNISRQLKENDKIIIVDSSDSKLRIDDCIFGVPIIYIFTTVKSAAVQRNIGIEHLTNEKYLFFLDDDVCPSANYFKSLVEILERDDVVGVSGVALSSKRRERRKKPFGLSGILHRIFFLDSRIDGKVLASGVNIPVRDRYENLVEVEWLIGCSAWKVDQLGSTRFEYDFHGQSLAEDVIFSVRMNRKGKLVVNPRVELWHLESEIERPEPKEHWKMWVKNRRRLLTVLNGGPRNQIAYWWANLGQLLIFFFVMIKQRRWNLEPVKGLLSGFRDLMWKN